MSAITSILVYFFDPRPAGPFKFMILLIIIAAVSLIASILLRVFIKKNKNDKILKKLFKSLPGKIQTLSICLGVYVLSRYLGIPYLSMRIMNYIILAIGLYFIIRYIKIYRVDYPKEKAHRKEQLKLNQYIPRKGHKS